MNARLAAMRAGRYAVVERGALRMRGGKIAWIGPASEVRGVAPAEERIDLHGALVTPGLIDCHTHLVYAGDRAREFEMRLAGASYAEIARGGGGILATVAATRAASGEELRTQSQARLDALMAEGVTTVEVKSGYGLDTASELKCLRVARSLASGNAVRVKATLLAAHAVPPEFTGRAADYVALICEEIIPAVAKAGLADAVDAFCEGIGFSPAQTRRVFDAARRHGLRVKLHADQLSDCGGAALAAEYAALSADHLEYSDAAGIAALARSGSVAVLLPGAFYFLRETRLPPLEALRRAQVPIAIATDCNPGTSPCTSLLTIANMACTLFRMTPEEALAGITVHAARALGLDDCGTLEVGRRADLAVWDADDPAQLAWQIGGMRPQKVFFGGILR